MILAYDTETTGLAQTKSSLTGPDQPHLVSLSALVYDPVSGRIPQSMSLVVEPRGWEIPAEATAVHGITTEVASEFGHLEKDVLDIFLKLWEGGNAGPLLRVAHNSSFDKHVIACAIARHHGDGGLLREWLAGPDFCTMNESKRIVNAQTRPDAQGRTRLKAPRLSEAYEFFLGEAYSNAHSANADAVACLKVWLALQEWQA